MSSTTPGLAARRQHALKSNWRSASGSGGLVLCDVTSTYFEGRACAWLTLAIHATASATSCRLSLDCYEPSGLPVAVEVFEGNTADPMTLAAQLQKLRQRFGLSGRLGGESGVANRGAYPRRTETGYWLGVDHSASGLGVQQR